MPAARQSTRRTVIDGRAPRARARAAASISAKTGGTSSATRKSSSVQPRSTRSLETR